MSATLEAQQKLPASVAAASVLDVTLRDGGYLNDWRFSTDVVYAFVGALASAGVPYIEVGYIGDDQSRPPVFQCTGEYLAQLREVSCNSKIVAMLALGQRTITEISECLRSRSSVVDVVRLTCTPEQISKVQSAAEVVAAAGITCSINLISVTAYAPDEILACVAQIDADVTRWLYLADSRGALTTAAAAALFADVRSAWPGKLGFHGHDNMGLAIANSRCALDAGFDLIDGSLNGYGLGGGNTNLLGALSLVPIANPAYAQQIEAVAGLISSEISSPPPYQDLYPLAGQKNLEQEWVPDIWQMYRDRSEEFMKRLQWRRYKELAEITG